MACSCAREAAAAKSRVRAFRRPPARARSLRASGPATSGDGARRSTRPRHDVEVARAADPAADDRKRRDRHPRRSRRRSAGRAARARALPSASCARRGRARAPPRRGPGSAQPPWRPTAVSAPRQCPGQPCDAKSGQAGRPPSCFARSRSANFCTLPVEVFGNLREDDRARAFVAREPLAAPGDRAPPRSPSGRASVRRRRRASRPISRPAAPPRRRAGRRDARTARPRPRSTRCSRRRR